MKTLFKLFFFLFFPSLSFCQCTDHNAVNADGVNIPIVLYPASEIPKKYNRWTVKIDSVIKILNTSQGLSPNISYRYNFYNAQARYRTRDIVIGIDIMDEFMKLEDGFNKFTLILCHEYGHLLQYRMMDKRGGLDQFFRMAEVTIKPLELQADFLAGHLVCHTKLLDSKSNSILAEVAEITGDYGFFDITHHGTYLERLKAMEDGMFFCDLSSLDNVFDVSYSKIQTSLTYQTDPRIMGNFQIKNMPTLYLNSEDELLISNGTNFYEIGSVKGDNDTVGVFYMDFLYNDFKYQFKVISPKIFDARNIEIGTFNFTGGIVPKQE